MKGNFGTLHPHGKNAKTPAELPRITEAAFLRQVLQLARLHGWRTAHFRPGRRSAKDGKERWETAVQGDGKGFPDLILLKKRRQLVVELKVGMNLLTTEQGAWLDAFKLAGVEIRVWYPCNWPEIEQVLSAC